MGGGITLGGGSVSQSVLLLLPFYHRHINYQYITLKNNCYKGCCFGAVSGKGITSHPPPAPGSHTSAPAQGLWAPNGHPAPSAPCGSGVPGRQRGTSGAAAHTRAASTQHLFSGAAGAVLLSGSSRLHLNYVLSLNCERQVQPLSLAPKWQIKTRLDGVYG